MVPFSPIDVSIKRPIEVSNSIRDVLLISIRLADLDNRSSSSLNCSSFRPLNNFSHNKDYYCTVIPRLLFLGLCEPNEVVSLWTSNLNALIFTIKLEFFKHLRVKFQRSVPVYNQVRVKSIITVYFTY